jgi:hypothetical protein
LHDACDYPRAATAAKHHGILMGLLVLASGRNLWPVIIGHGLFDASRFVLFYFQGPPTG